MVQALVVLVVAASPVLELRGAIPLALFQYGFDPFSAYCLSVLGNVLPVPLLLLGLEKLLAFAAGVPWLQPAVDWWIQRTRHAHSKAFERWGAVALVLFVAVPLPATGAWSGCLGAVLFGVPFRIALPLIALGVLIAGALVTLLSVGALSLAG